MHKATFKLEELDVIPVNLRVGRQVEIPYLFDAYDAGDEDAKAVLEDYGRWAAAGIINLQAVLDLPRYAIGGGISARPEATTLIRKNVDRIFELHQGLPFSKPEIVTCQFGNEANLIGALAFYLRRD